MKTCMKAVDQSLKSHVAQQILFNVWNFVRTVVYNLYNL